MPIISTFFGIVIRMYYQEHAPPHFHAEYQGRPRDFRFRRAADDGQPELWYCSTAHSRMGYRSPFAT
jgi:Domain of unknown function (DUF4160)